MSRYFSYTLCRLNQHDVCHTVGAYKGTESETVQLENTFVLITHHFAS